MMSPTFFQLSNALATTVKALNPSLVRVEARRCAPASGLV